MAEVPKTAVVLAAGRGARMRPLTEQLPKPLIRVAGRALIDRALDRLADAGVERVAVNLHHRPELVRGHLSLRHAPEIVFSDESDGLLDTGGGVLQALARLQPAGPFFVVNADALWLDGKESALRRLAEAFDPATMDALLLLHATPLAIGYDGTGDFMLAPDGRVVRKPESRVAPFVFTGVQILTPGLFRETPGEIFSLNRLYDRAAEAERLFGVRHDGPWMQINTPAGVNAAEEALA